MVGDMTLLQWVDDHEEIQLAGPGRIPVGPLTCDWYAQSSDREYLIPVADPAESVSVLGIREAGHWVYSGDFQSLAAAQYFAESWEGEARRRERDARVAEGYFYAQREVGISASAQKAFGRLWAERYLPQGWSIEDAFADYRNG